MDTQAMRRTGLVLGGGAVVAILAGAILAWSLIAGHRGEPRPPPPASRAGLVIDENSPSANPVVATKPLRCFVAGQFVGDFTLAECALRNGVATDKLDVGVDPTGALAAAQQGGSVLTPLPPRQPARRAPPQTAGTGPAAGAAPAAACWRYADGAWGRLPDMALGACVQTLFAGHCERPGSALYGRWGQETLRLVPGKVESSGDNRSFRTLVEQGPGCSLPSIG
jgi:hypothetical protein